MKKGPPPRSLAERFWEKVVVIPGGCWGWTAFSDYKGYGKMRGPEVCGHRGRNIVATRISWELHFGPIPSGLCVLHRCDNPPCTNPEHLFLGTLGDNNRDATAKGRNAHGSRNGQAKLTEEDVRRMRVRIARGDVHRRIAEDFGVTFQLVSMIALGKLWKTVISEHEELSLSAK